MLTPLCCAVEVLSASGRTGREVSELSYPPPPPPPSFTFTPHPALPLSPSPSYTLSGWASGHAIHDYDGNNAAPNTACNQRKQTCPLSTLLYFCK